MDFPKFGPWFRAFLVAVAATACDGRPPEQESPRTFAAASPAVRPVDVRRTPARCPAPDSVGLLLTFFDVGQGDAALLVTPERRRVLIDGGRSAARISELLSERGIDSLDLVIASHNHADHIGGLPRVIATTPIANYIENGEATTTGIYLSLAREATRRRLRVLEATRRTLTIGSLRVHLLSTDTAVHDQNLRSIGAVVSYGSFRAIFTGDAETETLDRWLRDDSVPRATVVKVGHHGSGNGTTPEWVKATSPRLAVISVGAANGYGHPAMNALGWWTSDGRTVLRTDQSGTIDVRGCRDGTFSTATERRRTP